MSRKGMTVELFYHNSLLIVFTLDHTVFSTKKEKGQSRQEGGLVLLEIQVRAGVKK